jgi:hypothetical protein
MFTQIVQQLSRFLPQSAPSRRAPDIELHDAGWHAPGWSLKQGADVIELPSSASASLFPDTQPAFHGPSEETSLAA